MGAVLSLFLEDGGVPSAVIETQCGAVRGKRFDIGDSRTVSAFLGIPYAKPPVGSLRFQKPQPVVPWKGVLECVQHAPKAPQEELLIEKIAHRLPKSEDCLYLNVFAPDWGVPSDQPNGKAVMIWIHGGGFAMHSSANYGDRGICKCLCSKDVIVVTIQYRLGILGFSATGDDNCIPNLGLWDQACALRWVFDNISAFGGDPNNITLFGQSAGAASVDFLSLSPYTRDLVSKVIPMGGSASCGWAMNDGCKVGEALRSFADTLGWLPPSEGSAKEINASLMKFLLEQPSHALGLGMSKKRSYKGNFFGLDFVPVIDGDFLPAPIAELRKASPKKACLTGVTEYEALLFAAFGKRQFDLKSIGRMVCKAIPEERFSNYEKLRIKATELYVNDERNDGELMRSYIRLFSDLFINNGVHKFAEDMTGAGHTVYLYNFEHFPPHFGLIGWWFPFQAATHCTELPYLFGKGIITTFRATATELSILEQFSTYFTNFAKFGDPNGQKGGGRWLPLSLSNTWQYLNINLDSSMRENFQARRAAFWNNLHPDLYEGDDYSV